MKNIENLKIVFSLYRHGERESLIDLNNYKYLHVSDLIIDKIPNIKAMGERFINKYKNLFKENPFKKEKMLVYISKSARTLKSFLYRMSSLIEQNNFEDKSFDSLMEFSKEKFNAIFEEYMFNMHIYSGNIRSKLTAENPKLRILFNDVEKALKEYSEESFKLYDHYMNCDFLTQSQVPYMRLYYIDDFIEYSTKEIKDNFTEAQKGIKVCMEKVDEFKRLLIISTENPNIYTSFSYKIFKCIENEIEKISQNQNNKKNIVIFSGHDMNLAVFLEALKIDNKDIEYECNDQIDIEIYSKNDNDKELFVRILYNYKNVKLPFGNNQEECPLQNFLEETKKINQFDFKDILDYCEGRRKEELFK